MMKKRLAVLLLALLPIAASAQTVTSRSFAGGGPGGVPGIAVAGHGSVRFTVKTIAFLANARGPADDAAVLAAMRAAGVDDPVVGPSGPQLSANNQTTLRGTIRDVTSAKIERIARAAADYVRAHQGVSIDNVNFFPRGDDCAGHEEAARSAAMADARRKAQAIAALAGVSLEGVVAVAENGGCPTGPEPPFGGGQPFDLATLTATVTVSENVTFAIVQGPASTRRRTL
jgi:uncharacterized protein DUF541